MREIRDRIKRGRECDKHWCQRKALCLCVCGGFSKVTVQNITLECGMLKHCQHKHINYTHTVLSLHSPTLDSVICVMKSALVRALCPVWELCIRYTLDTVYHTHILDQTVCQPHARTARAQDCSSFTIFLSLLFVYFAGKSDGARTHTHSHICLMFSKGSGDSLYFFSFPLAQAKILWYKKQQRAPLKNKERWRKR